MVIRTVAHFIIYFITTVWIRDGFAPQFLKLLFYATETPEATLQYYYKIRSYSIHEIEMRLLIVQTYVAKHTRRTCDTISVEHHLD